MGPVRHVKKEGRAGMAAGEPLACRGSPGFWVADTDMIYEGRPCVGLLRLSHLMLLNQQRLRGGERQSTADGAAEARRGEGLISVALPASGSVESFSPP